MDTATKLIVQGGIYKGTLLSIAAHLEAALNRPMTYSDWQNEANVIIRLINSAFNTDPETIWPPKEVQNE